MLRLSQDLSTYSQPRELTFVAGLHAFNPPVFHFSVTGASTVLEPNTARSATTGSARFFKHTALWARHLIHNR